jgi:hypothetical protein
MSAIQEAYAKLPQDADWSSSFGNPGEGGYVEYHRRPDGELWSISNGPYDGLQPFFWTCRKVA